MKMNKWLKTIVTFGLVAGIACSSTLQVRADIPFENMETTDSSEETGSAQKTAPLRADDNIFQLKVYSAKAGGSYTGNFFKRDNTLFVDLDTILKMAELTETVNADNSLYSIAREEENGAVYLVDDYETCTFNGQNYYPFIQVMTDLCITVVYDKEKQALRAIPAKNAFGIVDMTDDMYENRTYRMAAWRGAEYYDADTSRFVAKATDIGRHMFSLPSTVYQYASGDADYEMYRTALWEIVLPDVDVQLSTLDNFWEEKTFLDMLQVGGELTEKFPSDKDFFGFSNSEIKLSGKAAGILSDAGKILQYKDSMEVIGYYYNVDNLNASVANGMKLISYVGLGEDQDLNKAMNDVVAFNQGDTSLTAMILEEMGDGLVDLSFGKVKYGLNSTIGEFAVNILDFVGEIALGEDYTTKQLDAILKSTTNLNIQDTAKKAYNHYRAVYDNALSHEKKYVALQNMRDTMLVYMLAGHNAWKAMEFDPDLKASSAISTEEMAEGIAYLLNFGEEDFMVYQNAVNAKHAIMAQYEGREQSLCFVKWDKAKGDAVGGLELSIVGTDKEGNALLHKYAQAHIFYQQNGLFVGRINQASKYATSRTVTYYNTEYPCELVIKPVNAGASVAEAGVTVSVGLPGNVWTGDLSEHLVTLADGSSIYRLPLPLSGGSGSGAAGTGSSDGNTTGSATSDGTASSGITGGEAEYVPQGPFDGEYVAEFDSGTYTIRYNTNTLYIMGLSDPYIQYVTYASRAETFVDDNLTEIGYTSWDFERTKNQKIGIYSAIGHPATASETEELMVPNATIKYFTVYPNDRFFDPIEDSCIFFYVDFGTDVGIQGYWHEENAAKYGDLEFKEFLLELFGNMTVEKAE